MATAKAMVKKEKYPFNWGRFKMKAAPYVFISPFYLAFLVFGAFPILYQAWVSLNSWNGIATNPMQFVGLDNYLFVIQHKQFWDALGRTVVMMFVGTVPTQILALFFSFVLNSNFVKGKEAFKAIFFLPYVTSTVSIGLLFGLIYGGSNGLLNAVLKSDFVQAFFTLPANTTFVDMNGNVMWLRGAMVMFTSPVLSVWRWTGWVTILYFAALQSINKSLYEAARVDGATWSQVFFKITLPLLAPIVYFNLTMGLIGGWQAFEEPAILLGRSNGAYGGVDRAGVTAAIYMYNQGFSFSKYGRAGAAAFILLVFIIATSKILDYAFKER